MEKKEYEILKAVRVILNKMTSELKEAQDKYENFNLQIELDSRI